MGWKPVPHVSQLAAAGELRVAFGVCIGMAEPKRILVTGGTDFVGRQVVRAAREVGFDVRSCSRADGVDLRDGEAFGRYLSNVSPACVIHCAAHVGGIGYVGEHAIEVYRDNLEIALGLMDGMRIAGVGELVTVMPNCTYPGEKSIYREDEWWDGPIHDSVLMYGLPRKVLWGLCKTYGDVTGLRTAHLIYPNMYGPGDHFEPTRSHALGALIAKLVSAQAQGASTVEVWGTGKPVREWMHVADAARSIVEFLGAASANASAWADHPIYNVGVGAGVSIAELTTMIADAVGFTGRAMFDASRPDGAAQKLLDGSRFSELTGFAPRVDLQTGIAQTVKSYRQSLQSEKAHAH